MNYCKVLSEPMSTNMPNYKGLYRSEPFPGASENDQFISLWQRYVQNHDTTRGIVSELTINELKELAELANKVTGEDYEVIFFSEIFKCPYPANYYGIDVAGFGGYSMVGENFFRNSEEKNGVYHLYDILNKYFRERLNSNGLFNILEDAISFKTVLKDLMVLSPDSVEAEDWRIFHIYKII